MLIRHLSYFVTLAEEAHFGRAAAICNVAQPTLSAAIRKLEEDLEKVLIVRGHRFIGLTPDGEKVLKWGRQILSDYSSLRHDIANKTSGLSGTMRLGVIPAAMPSVSFLTAEFKKRHPRVNVRYDRLHRAPSSMDWKCSSSTAVSPTWRTSPSTTSIGCRCITSDMFSCAAQRTSLPSNQD